MSVPAQDSFGAWTAHWYQGSLGATSSGID